MNRQTTPQNQPQNTEPRSSRLDRLFPQGLPCLWCSMLTHFTSDGDIDWSRMEAHLNFMRPWVNGFLIAGPAGDGDTLNAEARQQLVQWASDRLKPGKDFLLAGTLLADDGAHALETSIQNQSNDKATSFVGLHVQMTEKCDVSAVEKHLTILLDHDLPVTVELKTETSSTELVLLIASLAQRYENLLCIGDATTDHQLARCTDLPAGVFRFRSTEGEYTRQLASNGGPCHGLLLSAANLFPQIFHDLTLAPALGKWDESHAMSKRLTALFSEVFALVHSADVRMLFKAIDHHMAHGPDALTAPPSFMHDGKPVDAALLTAVGDVLARHDFKPEKGYCK